MHAIVTMHDPGEESINNIIKTVVRKHHWEPHIIMGLFLDSMDIRGLYYWYEDVADCIEEEKAALNKKDKKTPL